MAVDVATVLVSTVAGGAGGVIFASWRVDREEHAKQRALAKRQVREAVADQLTQAVAYQAGFDVGRNDFASMRTADYSFASKVVIAARGLGTVRRALVRRRLIRVVGTVAGELAYARPSLDKGDVIGNVVTAELKAIRSGRQPADLPNGLFESALRKPPESDEVKKLKRQLTRLAASW